VSDPLAADLSIQKVRVTRWVGQAPIEHDRANPHLHPECLGVFEVDTEGKRTTIYERPDQCR
jgi:hypothetical protein